MSGKKEYIIVKDRHPRISEVLNDCVNLCVPTSGNESLASILQKICAKITSVSYKFEDTDTIHFNVNGRVVSANVQISATDGNILTSDSDGLYVPTIDSDQIVVLTAGTGIGITGSYPSFTITNTAPSSGGTLTAANQGTSLSGTTVQLGQLYNEAGDPAAITTNREIPIGTNQFKIKQGAGPGAFTIVPGWNDGVYNFTDDALLETVIYAEGFDYGWVKMRIHNNYDNNFPGGPGPGYGSAGSGLHISNSTNNGASGIGQLIQTFPGNVFINDGFMIRGTGAGGMRLSADIGNIIFSQDAFGTNEYARFTGTSVRKFAVGTATPHASAKVDITSTTLGFLPPRMTTGQRDAIATPAAGLTIYNTTTNKLNVFTTVWEQITSA